MSIIKTGICSYGMSGKLFHAPFIQNHPGFELSAIVERTKNESKEKYPGAKLYRSIEGMITDDELQLIIVNTPTHLHFSNAKAFLLAGKHVVVEKPFTVIVKEAEELAMLAEKKNLFLSVYQNRRYDGDFASVKKVITENLLGELKEVEIRYDRYRPGYGGKQHKEGAMPGAGIIYDLSPHLFDQVLQLFGWPQSVFADVWKMREDVDAKDYFEILFYYDRMRVRLKATCIARETVPAYILHGMKGSFLQHRSDLQEQQLNEGAVPSLKNWCPPPTEPDGLLHTEVNSDVVRKQLTSEPGTIWVIMMMCIRHYRQGANPVPASDGIKTVRIIEAALQSAEQKKIIEL